MTVRRCVIVGAAAVVTAIVARSVAAFAFVEHASFSLVFLPSRIRRGVVQTARHCAAYIKTRPVAGPLTICLHGFMELGIIWKAQMAYFAQAGWQCAAPEMRDYGRPSASVQMDAYTVQGAKENRDVGLRSRLVEPMRQDCSSPTEVHVPSGHFIMLEQPDEISRSIGKWLTNLPSMAREERP